MKIAEILLEMALSRKKAEQIFSGLEHEFNLHLLKLMGFTTSVEIRNHWKKELRTWSSKLSTITLKDDNRPVSVKDVFNWMYDETFGGREIQNVETFLHLLSEDLQRNNMPTTEISTKLKTFHQEFAQRINKHDPAYDVINEL